MENKLLTLDVRFEHDVVLTRQRARQIADILGFDAMDQTRIATSASEIARNIIAYAGRGQVEFSVQTGGASTFMIRFMDKGPGIPDIKAVMDGHYLRDGAGFGILGAKRLMDYFHIASSSETGTHVTLGKVFPNDAAFVQTENIANVVAELAKRTSQNPFEELQRQNQELLGVMDDLRSREEQLLRLNVELDETNRGVVALYSELDEKAGALQQVSEHKTRFLSNMSHEFRTPLNSIINLSRMLLEKVDGDLTPEQERQVSLLRGSAEGLLNLVNDLLDIAKIEAGKIDVKPNAFELSELFSVLRGTFRPMVPSAEVNLIFDLTKDIPLLYTDEGKLSQIMRNLISNGLKFTRRGEVRVAARLESARVVTLSVTDTGIGIAPEDLEIIFQEFAQVAGNVQNIQRGTGLGLPLSQKLATLLGGSLAVQSEEGVGSTFTVTIPLVYSGQSEQASV